DVEVSLLPSAADPPDPPSFPTRRSSDLAVRKAVSVFPEPVGAATRVLRPERISGQAARCASVGPPGNVARNQAATPGWKAASGSGARLARRPRTRTAGGVWLIRQLYFRPEYPRGSQAGCACGWVVGSAMVTRWSSRRWPS